MAIIHTILSFRIYALYEESKAVASFFALMLILSLGGEIYADLDVPHFTRIPDPAHANQFFCLAVRTQKAWIFWYAAALASLILSLLIHAQDACPGF